MKKRPPVLDEDFKSRISSFSEELGRESDRGLAMVAAAWLDESLETLLRSAMLKGDKIEKDVLQPLFRSEGPLGSFAGKTRICYALELIDEETFVNLGIIRLVRNDFAHSHSGVSFTASPVKNHITRLRRDNLLERLIGRSDPFFQMDEHGNKVPVSEEKRQFLLAVIKLCATLGRSVKKTHLQQESAI